MNQGSWTKEASCDGKQAYTATMSRKIVRKYPTATAYKCRFCKQWHIGRPGPKRSKPLKCL